MHCSRRSTEMVASFFSDILAYGRNTGSVSMYMAHGGTNFGFWAGSKNEMFQVTSYDYNCPISESGSISGDAGNGRSKFQVCTSTHTCTLIAVYELKCKT
jgi:beta-galactosidase